MNTGSAAYLETQIRTAPPQKLRLMLIEGAMRYARMALQCWEQNDAERAYQNLTRCRSIITELLAGIDGEVSPMARETAGVYCILFRTITEAILEQSEEKVHKAIEVLEIERETWKQLCEQYPMRPPQQVMQVDEEAKPSGAPAGPHFQQHAQQTNEITGGLDLDA